MHRLHFGVGQLEVEDPDVIPDVVWPDGFGDRREAFLYEPAEDDQGRRLAVGFGDLDNLDNYRIAQQFCRRVI